MYNHACILYIPVKPMAIHQHNSLGAMAIQADQVVIRPFKADDQQLVYDIWMDSYAESKSLVAKANATGRGRGAKIIASCALVATGIARSLRALGNAAAAVLGTGALVAFAAAPRLLFREKQERICAPKDMNDIQNSWAEQPARSFLVAEYAGKVVGATGVTFGTAGMVGITSLIPYQSEAYILRLTTCRKHRRMGIGSALVAAAEAEARKNGCKLLRLIAANAGAVKFFEHNGFISRQIYHTPDGRQHHYMEKRLAAPARNADQ